MSTIEVLGQPVTAKPEEVPGIQSISDALSGKDSPKDIRYFLADSTGKQLELPPSVYRVLKAVAKELAAGHSITVFHYDHEVTTQQAADMLQVSRPYLIQVLEKGQLPYSMVGTHRRIRMRDLLEYKQRRDGRRREALQELRRASEGLGLYDEEPED